MMNEKTKLIILCLVYVTVVFLFIFLVKLGFLIHPFTFYKAELYINGTKITEKLYFIPDKAYHTLYRNFKTTVVTDTIINIPKPNTVRIKSVSCKKGIPYIYTGVGEYCTFSKNEIKDCIIYPPETPYVKPNEYGCTYKNEKGFFPGNEYYITATYRLLPKKFFAYNGEYFIKFVAYSGGAHPLLIENSTFFIHGDVLHKPIYFPNEDVVLLIKIPKEEIPPQSSIMPLSEIQTYTSTNILQIFILPENVLLFFPLILLISTWYFFGRENIEPKDIPSALSIYPKKRKAWEVAAYFNPPFAEIDANFFVSMLLELKRKEVLEITPVVKKQFFMKSNDIRIRILGQSDDPIEAKFLEILKYIQSKAKDGENGFPLKETLKRIKWNLHNSQVLNTKIRELKNLIKKRSKEYLDNTGAYVFTIFVVISLLFPLLNRFDFSLAILYYGVIPFLISYVNRGTLLRRFKKNFYQEYLEWQAFKKFLEKFTRMKEYPPEAVSLWDEYLTYATALGVGKKVLKRYNTLGIIDQDTHTTISCTISVSTTSLSSLTYTSGGSGFGGGGLGGGIGGGGGGGR